MAYYWNVILFTEKRHKKNIKMLEKEEKTFFVDTVTNVVL